MKFLALSLMKRSFERISIAKLVVLVAILIVGIVAWKYLSVRVDSADGGHLLLQSRLFTTDKMIYERHFDVAQAQDRVMEKLSDNLAHAFLGFPITLNLTDAKSSNSSVIDWSEPDPIMRLDLIYNINDIGLRVIDDIQITPILALMATYGVFPDTNGVSIDEYHGILQDTRFDHRAMDESLALARLQLQSAVMDMKALPEQEFQAMGLECAFNDDELEALISYAGAIALAADLILAPMLDSDPIKTKIQQENQNIRSSWMFAYTTAFIEQHYWYVWLVSWRSRLIFAGMLAVLGLLFGHLVRRDTGVIVREELKSRGVSARRRDIWRVILGNWRLWIFPASETRIRARISEQCEAIRLRRFNARLHKEARRLNWALKDHLGNSSVKRLLAVMTNHQQSEGKRERSLSELEGLLCRYETLKRRRQQSSSSVIATDDRPLLRQKGEVGRYHAEALESVAVFLGQDPDAQIAALSTKKLENLRQALSLMRATDGKAGVERLLRHSRFIELLDTRSPLMQAVRAGDGQCCSQLLSHDYGHDFDQSELSEDEVGSSFISGKRLILIGGDQIVNAIKRLESVGYELGATKVECISADQTVRLRKTATNDAVFVLIKAGISHKVTEILVSQGIQPIVISKPSPNHLRAALCKALV